MTSDKEVDIGKEEGKKRAKELTKKERTKQIETERTKQIYIYI